MENQQLKNILQSPYDRTQWITYLQDIAENKNVLVVYLNPKQIDIGTPKARQLIQSFYEIGKLTTKDGAELPLYEVILNEKIRIEYNKVGVNNFIKEYIVKDAIKGALVTFAHSEKGKNEWRFSFISKNSASDFFAEAESRETNPKKYTYIFGTLEEHKTAMDRLEYLKNSKFEIEDFFEAFSVEPISKAFFDTYKEKHQILVDYLFENEKFDSIFKKQNETDIHKEKSVRSFVSRLMGRVIFLYFLQKKNWLGASNTDYQDGSANFLSQLFSENQDYQEDFYEKALCPLFFNALNTPKRENDEFALVNGKKVCIPFLNGGLFDEDQEPENHRTIQFEKFHFADLFQFFDEYNFTIYENSPDDHTVAVDPEMLGHIFENLIDYNKDTGTFYTPKEIVQYMTQQSLLHHLHIKLNISESKLENLIKNQSTLDFSKQDLQNINSLLDSIKICDPAIGSGAFPMGILQEIFNLKALIAFELNNQWNPVQVKENIIQNSIYGVDLDEGAVEIARLRFWLSLVVDEKMPKALPNLDYKIMQGNSLVESYNGMDLSNLTTTDESLIVEKQSVLDFGEEYAKEITLFDSVSAENVQKLMNSYFTATNSDSVSKSAIKKQINELIEGKIHSKIYKEKQRLKYKIDKFLEKNSVKSNNDLEKLNQKSKEFKNFIKDRAEYENLDKVEQELISFQYKTERPYFLWHTYFADVLNQGGFDIVIGNPPYISTKGISEDDKKELENSFGFSDDTYNHFFFKGYELLKKGGVLSYITPKTYWTTQTKRNLRDLILSQRLNYIFDTANPFESAMVDTCITSFSKIPFEKGNEITFLDGSESLKEPLKYSVKQEIFLDTQNSVIFKPTEYNLKIHSLYGKKVKELYDKWWDKISTSKNISKNKKELEEYRNNLKPGDIALLGCLTEGGQGLATANNGKYIAVRKSTKWAKNIILSRPKKLAEAVKNKKIEDDRLPKDGDYKFFLDRLSEVDIAMFFDNLKEKYGRDIFGQGYIYRLIEDDEIADVDTLTQDEKDNGIDSNKKFYVPYDKGDKDGNRWYLETPFAIAWTKENVGFLKT
ncbi:Eco57I restriction-modification methylase domain-containing protein, partial [Capnocytophaga canis]|uniref:Eco57I restriction-modification methylase domain-containing protein n=1 Tax=Capnocytophaga canis TaxID=1848903 RepID=UPI0005A94FC3